jgi:hypothetical protein
LCQAPDWDWERLFQTATEEAVLPALAFAMNNEVDLHAPREVSDFLAALLLLNRRRNQHIWEELKTTVRLLNEAGIEPVLLKGAAYLADGVYSDFGSRYLIDLDLLVPKAHAENAFQRLIENGYTHDETDYFGRFRHHDPPLRRASVPIELHRELGLGPCQSILPAQCVIESSVPVEVEGLRVRIPSPAHLVTHLVMHSQIQHPYNQRIWPPLRAVLDLVRLQCRYAGAIDWAEVQHRFQIARHGDLLRLHLIDVRETLGVEVPIDCTLTPMARFRSLHRRVLRQIPALRYLDPMYMFSAVCLRRLQIVRRALAARGGMKSLARQLLASGVYERFILDVLEGRGR